MTESTRQLAEFACVVIGLGWFLGVEVWRGRSQDHSARMFLLHLTAPLVAIAFILAALSLLLTSDRVRALWHPAASPVVVPDHP